MTRQCHFSRTDPFIFIFLVIVGFQINLFAQPVLPDSQVTVHYDNADRLIQIHIHPEYHQPPGQPLFYPPFDIFMTTNPAAAMSGLDGTNWIWIHRTAFGETNLVLTNTWQVKPYFLFGTLLDSDNDQLTDAYEIAVSHTDPNRWDSKGNGVSDGDKLSPNKLPWHVEQAILSSAAIYANAPVATQGGACGQCTVYLPAPSPAGGTVVQYYLGGTAVLNSDYTLSPAASQLVIPAGYSSGAITLCAGDGAYSDLDLYADLILTSATSCPVDGTPARVGIVNTNAPGIRVYALPSWERRPCPTYGTNTAGFYFIRDGDSTNALTINLSTTGSTAVSGKDYAPLPAIITFPANVRTNWLPLTIIPNSTDPVDKNLVLNITRAPGYQLDQTNSTARMAIAATALPILPVVQVAATIRHATVSKPGRFVFSRSGPTNDMLRVYYEVIGDTVVGYTNGQHIISYNYLPGSVDIAVGARVAAVPVVPVNPPSTGEAVTVIVKAGGDYSIGTYTEATVQIDKP
jgi:hypothetical protein